MDVWCVWGGLWLEWCLERNMRLPGGGEKGKDEASKGTVLHDDHRRLPRPGFQWPGEGTQHG